MRSLPHIVVACGAVRISSQLLDRVRLAKGADEVVSRGESPDHQPRASAPAAITPLSAAIDYRAVAIGALLPDLFDKAVRRCMSREAFRDNDHMFGHTLLFNLSILIPGLLAARRGDPRLLTVAVAALTHLLADPAVRVPRTLCWPLLGLEFPRFGGWGRSLTVTSQAFAALAILVGGYKLWHERRLCQFLRTGRL